MYQPSETACEMMYTCCYNYIRKKIAESTGIFPSLDDMNTFWMQNHLFIAEDLGKRANELIEDIWEAGVKYGMEQGIDYLIDFMDTTGRFRPGIQKQFLDRLKVEECDLCPAVSVIGCELYNYIKDKPDYYHVKIEEDGVIYLDCSHKSFVDSGSVCCYVNSV